MAFVLIRRILFLLLLSYSFLEAAPVQRFQPLKDTLNEYGILKLPDASDYADVPAVAVLSLQEYKQNGPRHTRRFHKIIKIFTADGKQYTNIKLPCFSTCHVEARTIKANGKIINLPSKDLYRNQNLSGYNSPFFLAQFALPGVEPGDMVEYVATVDYPMPFFLEDFLFSEPYPLLKGMLVLVHPVEDSYAYVRYSPPGAKAIHVSQDRITEQQNHFSRTTFVVEKVPAAIEEPYSPKARQDLPGVRLILQSRSGRQIEVFKDWFSYGNFISSQITVSPIIEQELIQFVDQAVGNLKDTQEIIKAIYSAAEKRVQITDETIWMAGFEFRSPKDVFKDKAAAPHDFALFLATCFKSKRWLSDLVFVNSYEQAETSADRVFPLDLDLVFLNVRTPAGEFLLDCSGNGIPPFQLSSAGMNRFALGVPLFVTTTRFTKAGTYTSRTSFHEGNRSHIEIVASPSEDRWNLDFRWTLSGEFGTEWLRLYRQKGEMELRKQYMSRLRSHMDAYEFRETQYSFTGKGLEIRGKASRARKKLDSKEEVFQNDIWDSGFDLRPHLLENRVNRVVLPASGEFSSTLRLRAPGARANLPTAVRLDCAPLQYTLAFQKQKDDIVIDEKLSIREKEIKTASFSKFSDFLNQYYEKHFWAILVTAP
ncbi:DUF3857 domain-containing protein [bacterium]|nr:DUF3857 domain-containing protein [bacterium]